MKIPVFALAALLLGSTAQIGRSEQANDDTDLSQKDFNEKNNIIDSGETDQQKEAEKARLEQVEKAIKENNEKYKNGESDFEETLYQDSDETKNVYEKTHLGVIPDPPIVSMAMRSFGIIPITEEEMNTPENRDSARKLKELLDFNQRLPASYNTDVKKLAFVTKAKSQGSCGSCAAFGEVGLIESVMMKAGAKKEGLDLSEQYLMDCAFQRTDARGVSYGANGCNGAQPGGYTRWFVDNGGEALHQGQYEYRASVLNLQDAKKRCQKARSLKMWSSGYKVGIQGKLYFPSVDTIKRMVYQLGAVMTVVDATQSFQNYKQGVWSDHTCSTDRNNPSYNHAVLIVGWGKECNRYGRCSDYWMVKNSWGDSWANQGFIKVKMGSCWVGAISVGALASKNGKGVDPAPKVDDDDKESEAVDFWCDVRGRGYTIRYDGEFQFRTNGYNLECEMEELVRLAYCEAATQKCKPAKPGPTNGCRFIFGKTKEECGKGDESKPKPKPKGCTIPKAFGRFADGIYDVEAWNSNALRWVMHKNLVCKNMVCNKSCMDLCGREACTGKWSTGRIEPKANAKITGLY